MNIEELSWDKALKIYQRLFSLGYINTDFDQKIAAISLTCYITNELRKKGKKVNCYDVLLKIYPDASDLEKNSFLKSLGVLCEDLMYGCTNFPTFGINPSDAPKTLKSILASYCPF